MERHVKPRAAGYAWIGIMASLGEEIEKIAGLWYDLSCAVYCTR